MANDNQRDLVLAPNEYAYVLDETKGNVSCWVGPSKTSLSQSDKLVVFNQKRKQFVTCGGYAEAIQLFTSCPQGWYIALKNPAPANKHPSTGTSNTLPDSMQIGCKINIPGPASFALYPGQMAEVIKGHTLRSNQYLVARVYDAEALNTTKEERGEPEREDYFNGQILVIKGTEISFYIPPTGIEIKAINDDRKNGYVRDAVTLERLEYCILKDEDGNKRYVHGPEVVFPSPTETFIQDGNGNIKRNAIELSDISGVYVKVIADYEENGIKHFAGDELFITGKDQMIYYPRPEHTFITYNGRIMHHATAIPKGEGRYLMNRLTGEIRTERGPSMYLPDPREEVFIKRTLSRTQCDLWYPNNYEVLEANGHGMRRGLDSDSVVINNAIATFSDSTMQAKTVKNLSYNGTPTRRESNNTNRTNTFTPPRTISLNDSKYEGAVAVDVWTGYAVNVISKDGSRQVVCGPQTVLLDYDQTLETLELSTGKPKTTDNLEKIVFLRHENNRVSDIVEVETSDFVKVKIKLSYLVNFDTDKMDKWFSVDNYVKHLCDWARSMIKKQVKEFPITELCDDYHAIVTCALGLVEGSDEYLHKFEENGMILSEVEILGLKVEDSVQSLIDQHQRKIISRALDLNAAEQSANIEAEIIELNRMKTMAAEEFTRFKLEEAAATDKREFELEVEKQKAHDEEDKRRKQVVKEIQDIKDAIFRAEQDRLEIERQAELKYKEAMSMIEAEREEKSANAMKIVMDSISPQLASALNNTNNQDIISAIASAVSPYAIANGESVSDAIRKVVHGTSLEDIMENFKK